MIETVREKILANVSSELMNIQTANGYATDIAEVRKGMFTNTSITNYPTAIISFGNDVGLNQMEGYVFGENELDLAILVYLNATSENLTEEIESVIKDLYKFFQRDSSIAIANTSSLSEMNYIRNYRISETSPYVSGANNASVCGMLLKINYTNWIDSTPQPVPDAPELTIPIDGATDGDINQAFQWTDEADALSYEITIDDGTNITINQKGLITSSYTVPDDSLLSDGTTYNWRVRAQGANEKSNWSDTYSFTVNDSTVIAKTPAELGGNTLWLRSDLGITITSGRVSTWADQSGNSFDLSNSTANNRPTFAENAYGTHDAVFFDGSYVPARQECLFKSDPTGIFDLAGATSKSFMITFIDGAHWTSTTTQTNALMARANTSIGQQWCFRRPSSGVSTQYYYYKSFPKGNGAVNDVIIPELNQVISLSTIIITVNNFTVKVYSNGTLINEIPTVTFFGITGFNVANTFLTLGSTYANNSGQGVYNGYVFELAWWNKTLTPSEVASVYKYRTNLYGV